MVRFGVEIPRHFIWSGRIFLGADDFRIPTHFILDGLTYERSGRRIREHFADTGGFTDMVFAVKELVDNETSVTKAAAFGGIGRSTAYRVIRETSP